MIHADIVLVAVERLPGNVEEVRISSWSDFDGENHPVLELVCGEEQIVRFCHHRYKPGTRQLVPMGGKWWSFVDFVRLPEKKLKVAWGD